MFKESVEMRRGTCTEGNAQHKDILGFRGGAMPHISKSDPLPTAERPDHHWLVMAHFWALRAGHVDGRWGLGLLSLALLALRVSSLTDRIARSERIPPA
jgi:hypothetical protein